MMAQIIKVVMKTMVFLLVRMRTKMQVDLKEQEDFDRELKALLQESLESRKSEARSRLPLNMTVPMNVLEGSKDQRATGSESG